MNKKNKFMQINKKNLIVFLLSLMLVISLFLAFKNLKKNLDVKKDTIIFLEKNLNNKKSQLKNIHSKLLKKNINIENILFEDGIVFKNSVDKKIKIGSYYYNFKEFVSNDIVFAKHPAASSSAYIDYYNDNFFLITATGQIVYSETNDLNNDRLNLSSIKTNIQRLIKYSEFYSSSGFGVKDLLIHKNKVYVSYVKEHYKDCFSTSILIGDLDFSQIDFDDFYTPDYCVEKSSEFYKDHDHDYLVAHQSGGRMVINNDLLYLSTGDFRYRTLAQDISSDVGKLISINLITKNKKIISMGHRNPQGLFYDNNLNYLLSTEHGPNGGDEINLLDLNKKHTKIPNYGWPIASYGAHYYENNGRNDIRYKLSPLKKPHKKYGFIEPIKYFDPSVGISQIVGIPDKFYKSEGSTFLVGTMGTAKKLKQGMISLYFFELNKKNNKITQNQLIPIKSRIRDIIYNKDNNFIIMYLETNNSLAILKKI